MLHNHAWKKQQTLKQQQKIILLFRSQSFNIFDSYFLVCLVQKLIVLYCIFKTARRRVEDARRRVEAARRKGKENKELQIPEFNS